MRDMTDAQFKAALARHGINGRGFLGYYTLPCGVDVSVINTGSTRRRAWLAWLIGQEKRFAKRFAKTN